MGVKKNPPKALSVVKNDFVMALQNVMDQGNLLIAALTAALPHSIPNDKVRAMIEERVKAFSEALYGKDE